MKRIALFVGVNRYANKPLNYAEADAEKLYSEFAKRYDTTAILVGEKATPNRIVKELVRLRNLLEDGDMFLFFFSGHGCEHEGVRSISIPNADSDYCPEDDIGISVNQIASITDVKGVHRLFVLDCCRANIRGEIELMSIPKSKFAGYRRKKKEGQIIPPTILSSCAPGQVSYENGASGHGFFTEAFIAALHHRSVKSFNTFRDRLDREMQKFGSGVEQKPYFEGGIGANLPFWPTWSSSVEESVSPRRLKVTGSAVGSGVSQSDVTRAFAGVESSSLYCGSAIPLKKRRNAWISMRVKCHDNEILALYDDTVFGGGGDGFVVTKEGIYGKNLIEEPFFVAWGRIGQIGYDGSHLIINDKSIHVGYAAYSELSKMRKAIQKLEEKVSGCCFNKL